jgi:chaperone protein EcpD
MYMKKILLTTIWSTLCVLVLSSFQSQAAIIVDRTRVIYSDNEKEVTIRITNPGHSPVLVQSWLDIGDVEEVPEKIMTPFIMTPSINRINPGKSQTLRLSYVGTPALPEDRESIFWLNILEIPPVIQGSATDRLQVAYRTRIKLFYRPKAVSKKVSAYEAANQLVWSVDSGVLKASNDSPYFISLVSVAIVLGSKKVYVNGEMVSPKGNQRFNIKDTSLLQAGANVTYTYIDDLGAVKKSNAIL